MEAAAAAAAAAAATQMMPTGFRFHPDDYEIMYYLGILLGDDDNQLQEMLKTSNNVFQWFDVYSVQPWDLFNMFYNHQIHIGYGGKEADSSSLYCVSPLKKKSKNGIYIDRVVKGGGTWKPQSTGSDIVDSRTGMPMGEKKQLTFVPAPSTKMKDNEDDTGSSGCSSKKRKHTPEEMEGTRYVMHEYTLCPSNDQIYSLCRIRKIIDKKVIINKKMRRSSSPTTNTTTRTVVQAVQEERATGYEHHQQENTICYNDGQQQQQQQLEVLPTEGVQIISADDNGLADVAEIIELWGVELGDDFLSCLEQDEAATTGGDMLYYDNDRYDDDHREAATTGGDLLYYDNGRYDDDHREVMNNGGVSEINIHPHVQISDDDRRLAQEIEEDLEIQAEWRRGATAEELGFFNIEEVLSSCY